jgi:hypothetical protein
MNTVQSPLQFFETPMTVGVFPCMSTIAVTAIAKQHDIQNFPMKAHKTQNATNIDAPINI